MGVATLRRDPRMTIDEFHDFVSGRPDDEKWELIDGEPILNATPVRFHQLLVLNIAAALEEAARARNASWTAIPGTSVIAPDDPFNAPEPDVLVAPAANWTEWKATDAICVFEVISPDSRSRDLRRKPEIYARSPTLTDYVVVSQKKVEAIHFAKSNGWQPVVVDRLERSLRLEGIGLDLPLAKIYRRSPLDPAYG
jgi:Uma2 family endonuclease